LGNGRSKAGSGRLKGDTDVRVSPRGIADCEGIEGSDEVPALSGERMGVPEKDVISAG
jgi:hypothetical protein